MTKTKIIQGKVKTVYDVESEPEKVKIVFHDKVTAGNGKLVEYPKDKGATCCLISALLFEKLHEHGVRSHFLELDGLNSLICKKLTIIPVEVIVRNIAAGSIVKTTHLSEGTLIQPPIVEFFLKDDSKNDPLLTSDRVKLMGVNTKPLIERALDINVVLQQLFLLMGMDLVDFKLEFGHDAHGDLFLADELSPDNMRLWKKGTKERFDKDLFRNDEGDIVEAYKTILTQLRQFS
jgi:phosphoribosylaminoimidazole-succinocarboxamide synthase